MSLNQDIRFRSFLKEDINNPDGLYTFIKPSRIIVGDGIPTYIEGQEEWYYIQRDNGDFFVKLDGRWEYMYNFGSGGGGGGDVTGAINVGTGEGVYKDKIGTTLEFKSLRGGEPFGVLKPIIISDTITNDEVTFSTERAVTDVVDGGIGSSLIRSLDWSSPGEGILTLKKLIAGSGIAFVNSGTGLTIESLISGPPDFYSVYLTAPSSIIIGGGLPDRPYYLGNGSFSELKRPISFWSQSFSSVPQTIYWTYSGAPGVAYFSTYTVTATLPYSQATNYQEPYDLFIRVFDSFGVYQYDISPSRLPLIFNYPGTLPNPLLTIVASGSSQFMFIPIQGFGYYPFIIPRVVSNQDRTLVVSQYNLTFTELK